MRFRRLQRLSGRLCSDWVLSFFLRGVCDSDELSERSGDCSSEPQRQLFSLSPFHYYLRPCSAACRGPRFASTLTRSMPSVRRDRATLAKPPVLLLSLRLPSFDSSRSVAGRASWEPSRDAVSGGFLCAVFRSVVKQLRHTHHVSSRSPINTTSGSCPSQS